MYQKYKQMRDNELESYLRYMNHEQGKTLKEIADDLECSRANVSRWFKKFNIEVMKNKDYFSPQRYGFPNEQNMKETLERWHHEESQSQSAIADELGCRRQTVIEIFKRLNIKTISHHLLHVKCGFNSDEEMAVAFAYLYHEKKMSKQQIADHFKITPDPVTWVFQRYDIKSRTSSEYLANHYEQNDIIPTKEEMNIINGMLLGDGHIEIKKHTALLAYTCKYEEVTVDAAKLLLRFNSKSYQKTYRSGGVERTGFRMTTNSYPFFKQLRSIWTSKEGRPADLDKSPPPDIELTPETCYWWYIGNGSTMRGCLKFCTHGFNRQDVEILSSKLPCESTIWNMFNKSQNKYYPIITINKQKERKKFLDFIGPCRHKCYEYKWRILNNKGENIYKIA